MVRTAVRRTSPRNRSAMPGEASFASRWAECHSSVSGTSLRIQKTSRAGSTPTRKTTRGLQPASRKVVHEASKMPMLTPLWSTAAIQGRQRRGQVSDSNEAPTAHSPPMPTAARNRTTTPTKARATRCSSPRRAARRTRCIRPGRQEHGHRVRADGRAGKAKCRRHGPAAPRPAGEEGQDVDFGGRGERREDRLDHVDQIGAHPSQDSAEASGRIHQQLDQKHGHDARRNREEP